MNTWLMYLSINEKPNMSQLYSFIFPFLEENKLKIFRWKLLQYIIPTKKLLMKWRIAIKGIIYCNNFHLNIFSLFSSKKGKMKE
jgi:hypothetical protein